MKSFIYIICGFLLTLQAAKAQQFLYQAGVDTIPPDGFYKINLSPQITGYLKKNMGDIRLYDHSSHEIPYIIQRESPVQYKQLFKEYDIVSKISNPKSNTVLVLRNAARSKINNISLIIQNTNVTKKAQLSGSNDAKDWYSIDDHFSIQPVKSQSATSEIKVLDFPLSDYEYYKLDIHDSASAPINIIKAGYYDTYAENGKYTIIRGVQPAQKDSASLKQSFVHIRLNQPVFIDKLVIDIVSPAYYRRQVEVKASHIIRYKRKREKTTYETVAFATLNSSGDNTIILNQFHTQDFYLLIHNEDNTPLQIKDVKAYQLNTYLIAFLKKAETYQLKFGQQDLNLPSYDLEYFKDKMPVNIPVIQTQAIAPVKSEASSNADTTFFTNKMLIWAALSLVILLLSYMSFRMVKDMKGNK